jgi:hypothetical protein
MKSCGKNNNNCKDYNGKGNRNKKEEHYKISKIKNKKYFNNKNNKIKPNFKSNKIIQMIIYTITKTQLKIKSVCYPPMLIFLLI